MSVLLATTLVAAAICGTAVCVVREPGRQALIQSLYGLLLVLTFIELKAPDVALSQVAVGVVLQPVLAFATLARIRRIRQ